MVGITPAYAGKTFITFLESDFERDHPRIRGENLPEPLGFQRYSGSPPHTRGKLTDNKYVVAGLGITPAYAGKTVGWFVEMRKRGDHPRIRGENLTGKYKRVSIVGSPPHTRGKRQDLISLTSRNRITPAYAGKT